MDVNRLKRYIYENNLIQVILEKLGCKDIIYHKEKEYYSASHPDGDNKQGVNIKNSIRLSYRSFSRNVSYDDGKDLISLVEITNDCTFPEALDYLCYSLGIAKAKFRSSLINKTDPLDIFKRINFRNKDNNLQYEVLSEDLIDEPVVHVDWFTEGIIFSTAKKFELSFDADKNRIMIPFRHWLTGELLGFTSRTTIRDYKILGIKKYYITPTYKKNINLYGLYQNYDYIIKFGYCVIFESEKSVLKRDSLLDNTCVALSGHMISTEQVRILLGLNVDIIVAMDKDVSEQEVWSICEKFYPIRNVYYIKDSCEILEDKDSPADAKNKDYCFLFKNKIRYNNEIHLRYKERAKR